MILARSMLPFYLGAICVSGSRWEPARRHKNAREKERNAKRQISASPAPRGRYRYESRSRERDGPQRFNQTPRVETNFYGGPMTPSPTQHWGGSHHNRENFPPTQVTQSQRQRPASNREPFTPKEKAVSSGWVNQLSDRFGRLLTVCNTSRNDSVSPHSPWDAPSPNAESESLPPFGSDECHRTFGFIEVRKLYYSHGQRARGRDQKQRKLIDALCVQFRKGVLPGYKRKIKPTIYDTVYALLFGNQLNPKGGLLHKIAASEYNIDNVPEKDLQRMLYETMAGFKALKDGWSGIPEVVEHGHGRRRRFYSNNNRSLYVLQCIQRVFGDKKLKIPYIPRNCLSDCHGFTNVNTPEGMVVQVPDDWKAQNHPSSKAMWSTMFPNHIKRSAQASGKIFSSPRFCDTIHNKIGNDIPDALKTTVSRFGKKKKSRNDAKPRNDAWTD